MYYKFELKEPNTLENAFQMLVQPWLLFVQTTQRRWSLDCCHKRTSSCHWWFASNSNGGFRRVVVQISVLWPVCFLGDELERRWAEADAAV